MLKGLVASPINLGFAFVAGAMLPRPSDSVAVLLVGFFDYGISPVLFVLALRNLGPERVRNFFITTRSA